VSLGVGTVAAIGSVALHDGSVHIFHKLTDEFRTEMVALFRFSGADFHSYLPFGLDSQGPEHVE
jgi:hypothetical protein